jgi:hypothetical protein
VPRHLLGRMVGNRCCCQAVWAARRLLALQQTASTAVGRDRRRRQVLRAGGIFVSIGFTAVPIIDDMLRASRCVGRDAERSPIRLLKPAERICSARLGLPGEALLWCGVQLELQRR